MSNEFTPGTDYPILNVEDCDAAPIVNALVHLRTGGCEFACTALNREDISPRLKYCLEDTFPKHKPISLWREEQGLGNDHMDFDDDFYMRVRLAMLEHALEKARSLGSSNED